MSTPLCQSTRAEKREWADQAGSGRQEKLLQHTARHVNPSHASFASIQGCTRLLGFRLVELDGVDGRACVRAAGAVVRPFLPSICSISLECSHWLPFDGLCDDWWAFGWYHASW